MKVRLFVIVGLIAAMRGLGAEQPAAQVGLVSNSPPAVSLEQSASKVWKSGVGQGFARSANYVGTVAGAGLGVTAFGSKQAHDLALIGVSYGKITSDVKGQGHWYRGNWDLRAELFGGAEFSPSSEYLIGVAPHIRYHFATGSRFVPFVDVGAGVSSTGIGPPDLGGRFQFNLQAGVGMNYFLRPDLALSVESRFLHLSSARISTPNLGVNSTLFLVGLSWFY